MGIRPFDPADQPVVGALIQAGLRERWGSTFDETANPDTDDLAGFYTLGRNRLIVATEDDVVVGCGALVVVEPGVARIMRMSVASSHRRQGIARTLVDRLVEIARSDGHRTVLVSTDTPWHSALELYRSCGFAEISRDETDTYFALELNS